MQKRAIYSGPYSLIFAAVAVLVAAIALVRQDSMITVALATLGLYVLHLLSLRDLAHKTADADREPRSPVRPVEDDRHETPRAERTEESATRRPLEMAVRASAAAEVGGREEPLFFSPESGFAEETGDSPLAPRQLHATEDSTWMVHGSGPDYEPDFVPADSEVTMPDFAAQKMSSDVPIPRKFALGTVAIIRRVLDPAQVARVLEEQRKFPKKRFGEIAVELDFITEAQLEDLLESQKAGLFTEEEIQEARRRLETFRQNASSAAP